MKGRYPTEIIIPGERLERAWFERDVLEVAPGLISKVLAISTDGGITARYLIPKLKPTGAKKTLPVMQAVAELSGPISCITREAGFTCTWYTGCTGC